jgi:hypothetical protein
MKSTIIGLCILATLGVPSSVWAQAKNKNKIKAATPAPVLAPAPAPALAPPAPPKKMLVPGGKMDPTHSEKSHRGLTAFFGPVYFQEKFDFLVSGGVNKEPIVGTSIGLLAGVTAEYQWEWLSIRLDLGVIGAVNTLENEGIPQFRNVETRSMLFGALLRPKLLARLGPIELGPTFPVMARWVNYSTNVDGAPDTKDLTAYLGAGAHLNYDFGSFRIGADWALTEFQHNFFGLDFQFEL